MSFLTRKIAAAIKKQLAHICKVVIILYIVLFYFSGICKFGIKLSGLDPLRKYDICADAYNNDGVKNGPSCLQIKTLPEVIIDRKRLYTFF